MSQPFDEKSAADRPDDVGDPVREADLARVLEVVPRGTFALCALAVALTLIGWLVVYGIFLTRGPVS